MEQEKREGHKPRKFWRFLLIVLLIWMAVSLIGDLLAFVIHLMGGFSFWIPNAVNVGIMGGADGPTAVFVTSSITPVWMICFKILLLVAGICGFRSRNGK